MGHTSATNGGPSRLDGHAPPVSGPIGGALTPLCLRSLVDSYDHGRQLFSHQLFDGVWREVDDLYPHETLTSSSIALLGLARSGESGDVHGILGPPLPGEDPSQPGDASTDDPARQPNRGLATGHSLLGLWIE